MSKPKLGIDIDEILRSKWAAFDRYYVEEFGEEGVTEPFDTYDLRNHYKFVDTVETQEFLNDEFLEDEKMQKISPKEYLVDEATGRAAVDAIALRKESVSYTADEMFEKFLYTDYCYDIHGSAPKLYMNADVDLNVFLKLYAEYFDVFFYVKTKKQAIPSTLFFLSKMRIEVKNILFAYTDEEIWNKLDWIITTNPNLLENTPEGKTTIKLTRMYNIASPADYICDQGTLFGLTNQEADEDGLVGVIEFKKFLNNKLNLNL
jgi:hypothetical protein